MEIKVYIDVLFLTNLSFDFFLLYLTAMLTHAPRRFWRMLTAAVIGAASAVFAFFLPNSFLLSLLCKTPVALLMVALSFGAKPFRVFVKYSSVFLTVSLTLGGGAFALCYSLGSPLGAVFHGGTLYVNLPLFVFLLPPLFYALIKTAFSFGIRSAVIGKGILCLHISYKGKTAVLRGFFDSGNLLSGPDGRGIIIAEAKALAPLLTGDGAPPTEPLLYRTLQGAASLPVFLPEEIWVQKNGHKMPVSPVYIGISQTPLSRHHHWDAILPHDFEGVTLCETSLSAKTV